MPVTRMIRLPLVLALAIACSSDATSPPTGDLVNAVARAQCGPADGPAVEIFVTRNPLAGSAVPSAPFVRLYVPVDVSQLTERPWGVGYGAETGAWFQADASHSEAAIGGALFVGSVDAENTITGIVDLDFPVAGHFHGSFRATWIPSHALCV